MKVKRIGHEFIVKVSKCGHYYIALMLNNKRVTAWHRVTKKFINKYYQPV
jgi:hypothetical protein